MGASAFGPWASHESTGTLAMCSLCSCLGGGLPRSPWVPVLSGLGQAMKALAPLQCAETAGKPPTIPRTPGKPRRARGRDAMWRGRAR
eukprot:4339507-Alexandrium_andersonii.AAC.1